MAEKSLMSGKGPFYVIAAIGAIVLVIGVPLVVGRMVSSKADLDVAGGYESTKGQESSKASHRKRMEASIEFNKDSPVMRIAHDVRLDPTADQIKSVRVTEKEGLRDFWAFFAVVKVKHLSAKGARHIFALKYDANKPLRPGWGIAFHKMGSDIFPEVYWGTSNRKGRWYSFMPVSVQAGEWWAVAISFEENRYLVLHSQPLYGQMASSNELKEGEAEKSDQERTSFRAFRGAYDLNDAGAALSSADLMLGASPGSNFKGGFGFFGVARVKLNRSENWFGDAVALINNASRADSRKNPGQENVEESLINSLKSDASEFVFGSFDGRRDIVNHKLLP